MKSRSLKLLALLVLAGLLAGMLGAQRAGATRHKRSSAPAASVLLLVLLNDPVEIIRRSAMNEEQDARRGREFNYSEMTLRGSWTAAARSGLPKPHEASSGSSTVTDWNVWWRRMARPCLPATPPRKKRSFAWPRNSMRRRRAQDRAARLKAIEKSREDERGLVEDVPQAYKSPC